MFKRGIGVFLMTKSLTATHLSFSRKKIISAEHLLPPSAIPILPYCSPYLQCTLFAGVLSTGIDEFSNFVSLLTHKTSPTDEKIVTHSILKMEWDVKDKGNGNRNEKEASVDSWHQVKPFVKIHITID